ncbi:uncharacterized protein PRD47_016838 isoform 4-T4 [Ara ararauna]
MNLASPQLLLCMICTLCLCGRSYWRRMAKHTVQIGTCGDKSCSHCRGSRCAKSAGIQSPLCTAGVCWVQEALLWCCAEAVPAHGCAHRCLCMYVGKRICLSWPSGAVCVRTTAITGAKGQGPITLPRRTQALSSLRGLASACWRRIKSVPGHSETAVRCSKALPPSDTSAMLGTLMTALFFVVRAFGQLGSSLFHEEPLPYLVYQPLPWQIQCVTQSRRSSRDSERGRSSRHNSIYSISGEKVSFRL